MANPPATLTEEFHTAQTLLELHGDDLDSEEQNQMENRVIFTELLSDNNNNNNNNNLFLLRYTL